MQKKLLINIGFQFIGSIKYHILGGGVMVRFDFSIFKIKNSCWILFLSLIIVIFALFFFPGKLYAVNGSRVSQNVLILPYSNSMATAMINPVRDSRSWR